MELVLKPVEISIETKDWVVVDLQELVSKIGSGITPKGGSNIYKTQGRPFVRSQNIGWGNLKLDDIAYIEEAVHQTFPNTEIKLGDVFLNISGASIGRSSVATPQLIGGNVNQHVCIVRTINNLLDSHFLCAYLLSSFGQRQIDSFQSGGNREGLNIGQIRTFKIPLPPLHEQQAIAQVLSDTDKLIQSLEKKIVKKKLIKQGVMQQLLTPKEGWETVVLDDVMKVSRGGSPRPIQNYITSDPKGVNWIKIGDTSRLSKYIVSSKERIIEAGVLNSRKVSKGDFLLSNSMSFGRPYILKIDGCIHDGWLVLQEYEKEFNTDFLYYTLTSKHIYNQYLSKASGSGVLNLNKELVKTIELNRPVDLKEQERISKILSDIDNEIVHLEEEQLKFQTLKQGLMQQLLTGKIRLV